MRSSIVVLACTLLLSVVAGAGAAVAADVSDHPLVKRYEGSRLKFKEKQEFTEYHLVTGMEGSKLAGMTLKGRLTRIIYSNPDERSPIEIFENYKQAMAKAGAEEIFSVEIPASSPDYVPSAWYRFNGTMAAAEGDFRYYAGKVAKKDSVAYVAIGVGKLTTQLDVLEVVDMEKNRVRVDAEALARAIDQYGKASVYGIYFDVDKAEIRPESKQALDEIAKLLRRRPQLEVYIVGHTDMTGTLAHNLELSRARAAAIVQALVKRYHIDPKRLEGHGVGPLAPAASNATEMGRAKNRRVEIVAR